MSTTESTESKTQKGGFSTQANETSHLSSCQFSAQALSSRISTKNFAAVVVRSMQADLSDPSAVLEDGIVLLSQNTVILGGLKKKQKKQKSEGTACTAGH
jgi:hypothetical protein